MRPAIISNTRKKRVVYNEVIAGSTFQSIFSSAAEPAINYHRPEPVGIFRDSPSPSSAVFLGRFPREMALSRVWRRPAGEVHGLIFHWSKSSVTLRNSCWVRQRRDRCRKAQISRIDPIAAHADHLGRRGQTNNGKD